MKTSYWIIPMMLLFVTYASTYPPPFPEDNKDMVPPRENRAMCVLGSSISSSEIKLRLDMRKLWEDHVTWTRMYIVNFAGGIDDDDQAALRLMKNQEDIGDAIKPYYGEGAGEELTALLKDHITIAVDLLDAAKRGEQERVGEADRKWRENADDIAEFLSDANPRWQKDEMRAMFYNHLDLTKDEAVARLNGDYEADVDAYDQVHEQALTMADELSEGIVKQFPSRFNRVR